MKIRPAAFILAIFTVTTLSGCAQSCFKSSDILVTQESIGDEAAPDIAITKFPMLPANQAAGCQLASVVRVELLIDTSGYAQGVKFLDPWPNDCANAYTRSLQSFKLIDAPLSKPLEHFRVDIHNKRVNSRQCLKLE